MKKKYLLPQVFVFTFPVEAVLTTDSDGEMPGDDMDAKEFSFSFDDDEDIFANPKDLWGDENQEDW